MAVDRKPSASLSLRRDRCAAKLFRYFMLVGTGLLLAATQGQGQPQNPGPAGGPSGALHPAFESFLRGADGIRREDLDPAGQRLFDRIAKRLGVTDGQITRAQLHELSTAPPEGSASRALPKDRTAATRAGAPVLPNSATEQASQSSYGTTGPTSGYGSTGQMARAGSRQETKAPLIYRSDNLPQELPAWFRTADTNRDGQIALHEWRRSGRSLAEFRQMDRNGDGFLTVEEVLYYLRQRGDVTAGMKARAAASR